MFIGSLSAGTDSGTIAAGAGPGAGTYRLGGGGGTLTLSNSNAIATLGANLIVDQVGGFDQNNLPYGVQNGQGTVKFTNSQANLTGPITVNGGMTANTTGAYSGILEFAVPSGTAANLQPIGVGTNNVTLNGGSLQFDPPTTANANTAVTIGNLIVNGGPASLTTSAHGSNNGATSNGNSGSTIAIGGTLGIVRNEGATLFIGLSTQQGSQPAINVLGPQGQADYTNTNGKGIGALSGSGGTFFAVTNNSLGGPGTGTNPATAIGNFVPAGSVSNGMATYGLAQTPGDGTNVSPWIMYNSSGTGGTFLAYTSAGFVPSIPTVGNVPGVLTFATGSQFVNTISSDIVFIQNPTATDASMTANQTVFAIESTKSTGTVNIQSTSAAPITLTVTSGGISADEQNGNMNFGIAATTGNPTPANGVNVQFGATGTAEAVLFVGSNNGTSSMTFLNQLTAGSLTKTGLGSLFILSQGTNTIPGNVTVDEGLIQTGTNGGATGDGIGEFALGSGNNIVLNGGGWMIQSDTSATITHNILVGAAGGIFGAGTQQTQTKTYSGSIMDDTGTGLPAAGPLTLSMRNSSTFTFSNTTSGTNLWSGGTLIQGGGTVVVQNGVNFGTGSVEVFSPSTLTLQGASNLSSTAALTVDLGATANLQFSNGTGPVIIGSLNGGGSVVLGAAGPVSSTLQVGGNNASTTFSGPVSQISGSTSSLNKVGTGSLTLTGTSSYTGTTTVTNGTLRFNGSLTGGGAVTVGDSVNAGSRPILAGTGVIAGAVNVLGSSSPSAGTIAGASGAMLVLNGGLTLNNGSISSFTLTSGGTNNTNPLISTTGVNSLTFTTGSDTVNLSGTAALGTYDLISYTNGAAPGGTFTIGTNSISGPFNYTLTPTANQLDLIVSSAVTLTWTNAGTSPSNPGVWDVATTQNWASSVPAASTYADGDNVQFTDTNVLGPSMLSSPQNITISGTVNPGKIEFQNNSVSYSVGGGVIAGVTQLDLDATGAVTATVTLTGANTYTGGTFITNGTLLLGASSSGGSNSSVTSGPVGIGTVTIGATNGSNNTSMYLSGTSGGRSLGNSIVVASGGSGTVTIGGQNTSGIDAFGGSITLGNGLAGQSLAISEPSGGELDLSGGILAGPTAAGITINGGLVKLTSGSSTYAGTTTVSTGTLRVTNTSGSATGTGPVNVSSSAVLGGGAGGTSGAIGGLVTIAGGADLAPNGFTGTSSPGTVTNLTLNGGLTLSNSASLDYILGTSSDLVTLGGAAHTLTLGTGVTLNITQAAGFGNGTYDLINYGSNTVAAGSDANLSTWTDPTAGTYQVATFVDTGSQIDLTLTQRTATAAWNYAGSGNWSDVTKWSPSGTYPNGAGQTATFGSGVPANSINSGNTGGSITVTNDINPTLGTLTLDNPTVSYTLTGGTVTINNNNTGAAVNVNSGSQFIASNVALTDTSGTTFTVASSASLGVSGSITNSSTATTAFTVGSGGSLNLSGGVNNGGQLVTFSGAGNTTVSTVGISGGGGLTLGGSGTLTLAASNGYTGATQVNSGTLRIASTGWPVPPAALPSAAQAPVARRCSAAPARSGSGHDQRPFHRRGRPSCPLWPARRQRRRRQSDDADDPQRRADARRRQRRTEQRRRFGFQSQHALERRFGNHAQFLSGS